MQTLREAILACVPLNTLEMVSTTAQVYNINHYSIILSCTELIVLLLSIVVVKVIFEKH